MKKNNKLGYFVFIPVIVGIALLASGIAVGNADLTYAGIGVLFGGSFAVALAIALITIVMAIKSSSDDGKKRRDDVLTEARSRASGSAEPGAERKKLEKGVAKKRRRETGAKVFSIAFILGFIGCLFGGMIMLGLGLYVTGGVVFACGPAMIIIAIAVTTIRTKLYSKKHDVGKVEIGTVDLCELATDPYGAPELARYDVWVEINDERYFARADRRYKSGYRVRCMVKNNYKDITVEGPAEYSYARGDIEKEKLGAGSDGSEKKIVMREVELSVADPEEDREKAEINEVIARLAELRRSKMKKADKMKAYDEIMSSMREKRAEDDMSAERTEENEKDPPSALAHRIVEITRSEDMTEKEKFDARRAAIRDHFNGKTAEPTEPTGTQDADADAKEKKKERKEKPEFAAAPMLAPPVPPVPPSAETTAQDASAAEPPAPEQKTTAPSRKRTSVAYKGINRKK